jgi:hypothetical protein
MPLPTPVTKVQPGHSLREHEVEARMAPGGRLPVQGKPSANGERTGQVISDGSPNAIAAASERWGTKHKPELVAKRMAGAPPSSKR